MEAISSFILVSYMVYSWRIASYIAYNIVLLSTLKLLEKVASCQECCYELWFEVSNSGNLLLL